MGTDRRTTADQPIAELHEAGRASGVRVPGGGLCGATSQGVGEKGSGVGADGREDALRYRQGKCPGAHRRHPAMAL